jgi:hypothetical protein
MSGDLRALEDSERFERLDETLQRFPEFRDLHAVDREVVHYLAVHRMQYERLRGEALVGIPAARFALLRTGRMIRKLEAVFFQERVEGTTLWDMFDFSAMEVTRPWWPHLPAISAQLRKVLDSKLLTHVDWNIQNFVFRTSDEQLFYVDMKPTIFVRTQSNEQNLKGIREYFRRLTACAAEVVIGDMELHDTFVLIARDRARCRVRRGRRRQAVDQKGSRSSMSQFGVPAVACAGAALLLPLLELACAVALLRSSWAWWGAIGRVGAAWRCLRLPLQ